MVCRIVSKMYRTLLVLMMGVHAVIPLQLLKYNDLKPLMYAFDGQKNSSLTHIQTDGNPNYFRYLQPTNDSLYVGAMNYMFELNLTDLSLNKFAHFQIEKDANRTCFIQGNNLKRDCQNHIRVIMLMEDNSLFVCGTGAYSPTKYTLNLNFTMNTSSVGRGYCPFDPLDNSTSLYVKTGNPGGGQAQYFGTFSDFLKADSVFWRRAYTTTVNGVTRSYNEKLSYKENYDWLNSPQFVGSFDMENEVYFFFREIAAEATSSTDKIYSRVGKVCKFDKGGGSMKDKWLSFQKSRLLCSIPGNEPYYFDDIYDVYQSGDNFYALFYKQDAYIDASAICVYSRDDIVSSFRGNFKNMAACGMWEAVDVQEPRLDNCTLHEKNPGIFAPQRVSEHQLMDTDVQPIHGRPIYHKSGVQFVKLIVDAGTTARNIYVGSDKGTIYSLFMKDGDPGHFLVEEHAIYSPFDTENTNYAIWNMKLQENSLYLGSDYSVTKIDLSNLCVKYTYADTCIYDTRCKWACSQSKCYNRDYNCSSCADTEIIVTADEVRVNRDLKEYLKENGCIRNVTSVTLHIITGVYATLDINYLFSKTGQIVWKKGDETLTFEDTCSGSSCNSKYFLATNTGSLIIKNATEDDAGSYTAIDKTTDEVLAEYLIIVIPSTDDSAIINAWKQSFVEWSQTFNQWKCCAEAYLDSCPAP